MKLISMREFVLEKENMVKRTVKEMSRDLFILAQYAYLLSQPLTIGMFVPCDEEGNVLEEPDSTIYAGSFIFEDEMKAYNKAKERVLFEGFDLMKNSDYFFIVEDKLGNWMRVKKQGTKSTIEDLESHCICTLTQSSIKQLGL